MLPFRTIFAAVAACALLWWSAPAKSADIPVDLELVLAVDVSLSMDSFEQKMQLQGYVAAMRDPQVLHAVETGPHKRIAVIFVEWGGEDFQNIKVPWTLIDGKQAAYRFSEQLARHRLTALPRTSISTAALFSAALFEENGFNGMRHVIDISGDGPNNQGRPVEPARDEVLAKGIVINGLPLMTREGMGSEWHLDDLDEYYRHCVIGGPTAFVIPVLEWSHFPQAVRRKLVLELAQQRQVPASWASLIRVGSPEYDCLIGEKIWDDIQGDWN